jgi:GDSL-like lipase/acylhydrolase family protein
VARGRRRVGTVIAALLVGTLAGGLTLELLLRVGARGWSAAAFGPWEERRPWEAIRQLGPDGEPRPVPGGHASWRLQPWAQPIEYRLDQHGFRAAHGPASAGAPCRVLALGDSHTFGYGVGAEQAWPAMLESMLVRANVANAGLCGSGIAAEQAWLPDALAASHAQVVVIAVTPWSLREDPEPPEQHELDAHWPRTEAYFRRITRSSAVADRMSRLLLQHTSALIGWPPPAPVLWELAPLVEAPATFHARWAGVHARLARMVELVRRRGATPLVLFVPLDVQVSAARNELYRDGRLPYRTHGFVDRDYTRDDRYLRALDKSATKLRVRFLDATPMLRALAPAGFLPDSYHLAVEGHAHLAALLASPVAEACAASPAIVEAAAPAVPGTAVASLLSRP